MFVKESSQLTDLFPPVTEELLSNSKVTPPIVIVSPSAEPASRVPPAVFDVIAKSPDGDVRAEFLLEPVTLDVRLSTLLFPLDGDVCAMPRVCACAWE